MKISPADKAFADCVKESQNHTCEMCGKQGRMETSHVYSRRHRTIRWDKMNANCLCNGCHRKWHESPIAAFKWFEDTFGAGRVDILIEKREQRFKVPKTEEKEIARHYQSELKKLQESRSNGDLGVLEFISYQ